jgi:hypothetical protein
MSVETDGYFSPSLKKVELARAEFTEMYCPRKLPTNGRAHIVGMTGAQDLGLYKAHPGDPIRLPEG